MNSKTIIGTLVGAILLFVWQFISWGAINFHKSEQQFTNQQDSILSLLSDNLEEGSYFLPNVPPGTDQAAYDEYMKKYGNKPWAVISYHKSMETSMTMNMIRAFVSDLLAVIFLIWIVLQIKELSFGKTILMSLAIGMIGFLSVTYLNTIWFKNRAFDDLIDVFGSWTLVGAWLGWWLNRR